MTFKDIMYWSRNMSYKQLDRYFIRCIKNNNFRAAEALNSMRWLASFRITQPHSKIRMWKYAMITYKSYKYHP